MSSKIYKTPQENFWAGEFGDEYISRNKNPESIAARISLFSKILNHTKNIESVLELGANIGLNLHALHHLRPNAVMQGVEVNEKAFDELQSSDWIEAHQGSLLTSDLNLKADLTFTSGVLIHINPDSLPQAYDALYTASNKYICVIEYFNPSPVTINYRGEEDRLFKRDFAGEMLDKYSDLSLLDYGFIYKRDNNVPLDNMNWFLLEKSGT